MDNSAAMAEIPRAGIVLRVNGECRSRGGSHPKGVEQPYGAAAWNARACMGMG